MLKNTNTNRRSGSDMGRQQGCSTYIYIPIRSIQWNVTLKSETDNTNIHTLDRINQCFNCINKGKPIGREREEKKHKQKHPITYFNLQSQTHTHKHITKHNETTKGKSYNNHYIIQSRQTWLMKHTKPAQNLTTPHHSYRFKTDCHNNNNKALSTKQGRLHGSHEAIQLK